MSVIRFLVLVSAVLSFDLVAQPVGSATPLCGETADEAAAMATARAPAAGQCPRDGFAKHSEYVRRVRGVVKDALRDTSISKGCAQVLTRGSRKSTCGGPPDAITCCKVTSKEKGGRV